VFAALEVFTGRVIDQCTSATVLVACFGVATVCLKAIPHVPGLTGGQ
jgi:hypothetical protein